MQGIEATFDEVAFESEPGSPRNLSQFVLIAAAVAAVGCASAFALRAWLAAPPPLPPIVAAPAVKAPPSPPQIAAADFGPMIVEPGWIQPKAPTQPEPGIVARLEPIPSLNAPSEESVPPNSAARLPDVIPMPPTRDVPVVGEEAVPMPPARPPELNAPVTAAPERQAPPPGVALPSRNGGNVFQRLWGDLSEPPKPGAIVPRPVAPATPATRAVVPTAPVAPPAPAIASAPADTHSGSGRNNEPSPLGFFFQKVFGHSAAPAGYDRYTAVYDISARTVYMPDGTRLEAHSGLGRMIDDPRYVAERGKGATPPHTYDLKLRESLFHGVQAIRLTPVGDGGVYGRAGLLAHPYMLGPNGDSNGCVSFRDYEAFLRAFESGEIKRLAVVANL